MKRILFLLLLAVLLTGPVACGKADAADAAFQEELGEKTFVWEKEGFGGDFTITLNEDGTYQYYTGYLSSYIGFGNWSVENGVLTMKENKELCGNDSVFRFAVGNDELTYLADGSNRFMSVTVENGDRFLLRAPAEEEPMQPIPSLVIEANGKTFVAGLADNSSAEALVEKLTPGPVTVDMHDYGSFEKIGPLPWSLPRNDEQITTAPGDVILYQGNQITIYYDQNTWEFTRLAEIDGVTKEELLAALGEGDISVTFSIAWTE